MIDWYLHARIEADLWWQNHPDFFLLCLIAVAATWAAFGWWGRNK